MTSCPQNRIFSGQTVLVNPKIIEKYPLTSNGPLVYVLIIETTHTNGADHDQTNPRLPRRPDPPQRPEDQVLQPEAPDGRLHADRVRGDHPQNRPRTRRTGGGIS